VIGARASTRQQLAVPCPRMNVIAMSCRVIALPVIQLWLGIGDRNLEGAETAVLCSHSPSNNPNECTQDRLLRIHYALRARSLCRAGALPPGRPPSVHRVLHFWKFVLTPRRPRLEYIANPPCDRRVASPSALAATARARPEESSRCPDRRIGRRP